MEKANNNPNNRRAVALLKNLVKTTSNLSEMARQLNDEGFVTSRGCKFTSKQVSLLLKKHNLDY